MNAPQESQVQSATKEGVEEKVKGRVGKDASKAMATLKRKPALGAVLAGGLGFIAANAIGVGEVAIAMAASYAAYRALTS